MSTAIDSFLAAISSSRSDGVTQCVSPFVRNQGVLLTPILFYESFKGVFRMFLAAISSSRSDNVTKVCLCVCFGRIFHCKQNMSWDGLKLFACLAKGLLTHLNAPLSEISDLQVNYLLIMRGQVDTLSNSISVGMVHFQNLLKISFITFSK